MSFRESLKYFHQAGATAGQLLQSGPTVLHSLTMNTVGATTATVTIYDGVSTGGNVVAIITPVAASNLVPESAIYDVRCPNGLFFTVVGSGTTLDMTFSFE